ncbi:fumarate hydratase class I [Spirochaetia bacterium]|nr:fumarate hydratase class I [Spirochaetia bacterium]
MLGKIIDKAFSGCSFRHVDTGPLGPQFREGRLFIPPELLERAALEGFGDLGFYFRESHLKLLAARLDDSASSANDKFVISTLLKNAAIAARGELALCQDTGTAIVYAWKDESVYTGVDDVSLLEKGIARAYKKNHFRSSQVGASSFFDEYDTGNNLPAQVEIKSTCDVDPAGPRYRFLFAAKGGGSSNKTGLFPMTKSLLEEKNFSAFLEEKINALGTAACPPYRLAVVVGGSSPEFNLEVLKLATTEILDGAPFFGEEHPEGNRIFRDRYWEERAMEMGRRSGLGAQFGGNDLLLDVRVLRLPRHAASCPVSIGVSCAAHRNMLAFIDRGGLHLESLVRSLREVVPGTFSDARGIAPGIAPGIDLDRPMDDIRRDLAALPPGTAVLLSGKLLVARDAAHLKWHELLAAGENLPGYLYHHPVYYAGPAATPPGKIIGSLGPTTAQRMDPYADELMRRGVTLVTLAKGNRSAAWKEACTKYGGFYLGTIGGAAALLAEEHVTSSELIDYPELGMEAVRLITVRDLPAFIAAG